MKILICGSSFFRKEKLEIRNKLIDLGHNAFLDDVTEKIAKGEAEDVAEEVKKDDSSDEQKGEFIKWYYNAIADSDAVLVTNFPKKDIQGYVGGNTFLEIGFAFVLNKKIFFLYPIPEQSYADEIKAMDPIILNNNLESI